MGRTAVEDDGTVGEYTIPKGYHVFFSPSYIIRHTGEDCDTYNPDRYTEENMLRASKIPLAAFGSGPHVCLGRHLALLELKAFTAFLVQNGKIETDTKEPYINPHFPSQCPLGLTGIPRSKSTV